MITITLPYPPKHCWPNARSRSHYPAINDKAKARIWAHAATLSALSGWKTRGDAFVIQIRCFPKPRGPAPDGDNINAAAKAYIDGIALAMGVNDRRFTVLPPIIEAERLSTFLIEVTS